MTIRDLFDTIATLICSKHQSGDVHIKAKLIWRGEHNEVTKTQIADFGYSSGLRNELIVEMNTAKDAI